MSRVKNARVKGFRFGAARAGVRYKDRLDLGLILADGPAAAAGVFTNNRVKAPSVILSKRRISGGLCRAVLANSGNANTCVGRRGMDDAVLATGALAEALGAKPGQILMNSTGVIGEPLPVGKIVEAIPSLVGSAKAGGLDAFAKAIMTTDTRPKVFAKKVKLSGGEVSIAAAGKGAGMIMPNMATMLVYIMTDIGLGPAELKPTLASAAKDSFNALTIDGDTSTSDTTLLLASGASGVKPANKADRALFQEALDSVCLELAEDIAADGEGATKMFRVTVTGARSEKEADKIARRVANSPLVKTAFHAGDPNWGRVMMAVGSAEVAVDPDKIGVSFADAKGKAVEVVKDGALSPKYVEKAAAKILSGTGFDIRVELGRGKSTRSIVTCDFSADYVRINADYRS